MKMLPLIFIVLSVIIFALIMVNRLAKGTYLKTERADQGDVEGLFTVFFYGGKTPKQAVILDREDDGRDFEISGSPHNFTAVRGVPAQAALKEAVGFIDSDRHSIRRILDNTTTIGYDVRPLYPTTRFGAPDILDINYRLHEGTVFVTVRIKSSVRQTYDRDKYGGS